LDRGASESTHELLYDCREALVALDLSSTVALEPDPALVESVQHLDARDRISHALGSKDRGPILTGDRFRSNRTTQRLREFRCDLVLSHPIGTLELDDSLPTPVLHQQFGSDAANI